MTTTPPLLELRKISFTYPGAARPVLENIDFSLRQDQKIGLIGTNGSGKTTLFHIIMGLLTPTAGELLFQGRKLSQPKDFTALRRTIGSMASVGTPKTWAAVMAWMSWPSWKASFSASMPATWARSLSSICE